jgi:hypothetical protein
MATLVIQSINTISGEARTLSLILLLLAVAFILAGAVIAIITFSYARKHRASLTDKRTSGEQL